MTDDAGGSTVNRPNRGHQWVRSVSAVIVALSAIAVALGVLTMAEESIDHTDLMNDQNELLHRQTELMEQQISHSECVDQLMAFTAQAQFSKDLWSVDYQLTQLDRIGRVFFDCFSERLMEWDIFEELGIG